MANGEDNIRRVYGENDARKLERAYNDYVESMKRSKQIPKSLRDIVGR